MSRVLRQSSKSHRVDKISTSINKKIWQFALLRWLSEISMQLFSSQPCSRVGWNFFRTLFHRRKATNCCWFLFLTIRFVVNSRFEEEIPQSFNVIKILLLPPLIIGGFLSFLYGKRSYTYIKYSRDHYPISLLVTFPGMVQFNINWLFKMTGPWYHCW